MTQSAGHRHDTASCPVQTGAVRVRPGDHLHISMPKRMVMQRGISDDGIEELRLFYGDKEVFFDEPHLFAFGEMLARQSTFRALDAVSWASGATWDDIAPLLETLIDEQILEIGAAPSRPVLAFERARTGLHPSAPAMQARSRNDCAAITQELTGRAVDPGHLELVVPFFRVAHPALDDDGRQVGEANVFPRGLRVDAPTEWLACTYAGTRYMSDRPMNATALKTMRVHWDEMMAALRVLRGFYLQQFPDAAQGWTVGHVERVAAFVLAVPTFQLMRMDGAAVSTLHPTLSSLFRVTDGLRMAMHQMMFIPLGEPMVPFDRRVTVAEIHDYAERNYSFHSETGVCAGPKHLVQMFLRVLLEGESAERDPFSFEPAVRAALDDAPKALDYARHGLRAHAALFSVWPLVGRTYEHLADCLPAETLAHCIHALKTATYIGREDWRIQREATYARMFDGFTADARATGLRDMITVRKDVDPALVGRIANRVRHVPRDAKISVAETLATFALEVQAILRVAETAQEKVNSTLGRSQAKRSFELADADVHNRLQEQRDVRLPFLPDEIQRLFGLIMTIASDRIDVHEERLTTSGETSSPETRAHALSRRV